MQKNNQAIYVEDRQNCIKSACIYMARLIGTRTCECRLAGTEMGGRTIWIAIECCNLDRVADGSIVWNSDCLRAPCGARGAVEGKFSAGVFEEQVATDKDKKASLVFASPGFRTRSE